MKRVNPVKIILAAAIAILSCSAFASDTIPAPAGYGKFELLQVILPWTGTSNPGSLFEYNMPKTGLIQAGYSHDNSKIRLVQQPETASSYNAATKGYMKVGDLSLFGSFSYSNSRFNGSEYNGTLIFNSRNPYLLGDTVPAMQVREQFDMEGVVSYPLSDRLALGVSATYVSAVGAKQKDPRNKNNISALNITPGIIYNMGKTKVGLSGSWYSTSNEISYSVEGNWNQTLFMLLGLGYYRQEVNISSYSQWYKRDGYSGALQVSHENNGLFMLAELKYDHFKEEARNGSSFRLIDGITGTDDFSLQGLLRLARGRALHFFELDASVMTVSSDEILQRSYTVNKGTYSYDSLATVSWIENKHMVTDIKGALNYSLLVFDDNHNLDFKAGGSVAANYFSTDHYPVQSYGYYNVLNLEATLFAGKLLHLGKMNFTPEIDLTYRANLASDISYVTQTYSLPEMVYHDFYINKANIFGGAISLKLEKQLDQGKVIKSLFLIPEARIALAPGTEAGDLSGYMVSAVAGIIF